MDVVRTVAPTARPIDLAEAKLSARVQPGLTDDDAMIDSLIDAATEWAEEYSSRRFLTQTWVLKQDFFTTEIVLPRSPVQSVSSITYIDQNGAQQTVATSVYELLNAGGLYDAPRIVLQRDQSWPIHRGDRDKVVVTFIAGYGATSASVPEAARNAVKLLVNHLYWHRSASMEARLEEVPFGVKTLLSTVKVANVA